MHLPRAIGLCAALLATTALAGEKWIQNDNFANAGGVTNTIDFNDGYGMGVLLTPDPADYPLTLVAVDIFCAPFSNSGAGNVGAYLLNVWDETYAGGSIAPPNNTTGNRYTGGVALTGSTTQFNRFTFPTPITVSSGKLFIAITNQSGQAASQTGTTIALDSGPVVAGANFYSMYGGWTQMTGTGTGVAAINKNWIVRAVISKPDVPPTITGVEPPTGLNTADVSITITGTQFTSSSTVFLGTTQLTVTGGVPPTSLVATVPAGLNPGPYDVTVENPGPVRGKLTNGYRVLGVDGGSGEPDAGTQADAGTGADAGTSTDAGTDPDAGVVNPAALTLESITPTDAWTEDETKLVLLGTNFAPDVQVLVGKALVDGVNRKSASVVEATLQPGTTEGQYDVTVINPDGQRATLEKALTVHAGTSVGTGCNCNQVPPLFGLALLALAGTLRGRRRSA